MKVADVQQRTQVQPGFDWQFCSPHMPVFAGQEGHSTVAAMRGAIPDRWRAASTNTSFSSAATCAADGLNFTAVCEHDAGFEALARSTLQVSTAQWLTPVSTTVMASPVVMTIYCVCGRGNAYATMS